MKSIGWVDFTVSGAGPARAVNAGPPPVALQGEPPAPSPA